MTGLDIAPGLITVARRRAADTDFVVGDLERLPFVDGAFDVVTAINSIPYAANARRAIGEVARVTAPGGEVVITVGAGPDQASCAAMIDPLAYRSQAPDREQVDLRRPDRRGSQWSKLDLS